ncbi:MAG: rhodanese-like domain-containing protein, partial [Eudoraea sp.]|uniref:rhodanese-like domain-containing protein n=1 Tax=Eudoraea sp. TaxID=1979955 RepID=UPI003C7919CC
PDLAQKSAEMTKEDLAGLLYDSLRTKIMPLGDEVIVYPAHGAGSACGKNMMKETVDTLGNQKSMNYALRANMTKEEFVTEVTDGLLPPPKYFPLNVKMNKEGYEDIAIVLERGTNALSPDEFERIANDTAALVLDVRPQEEFIKGHIPRSIFIGLNGDFAPWVGALIADVKQPILLVSLVGKEEEAVTRLSRVGFDNTVGILEGGFKAWKDAGKEIDYITSIDPVTAKELIDKDGVAVFDVRKESEFKAEHLANAKNTPLDQLNDYIYELPEEEPFYVHCAGGYRSVIAASILKSRGIHNLIDLAGGFGALKKEGAEVTNYVCPSTL